MSVEMISHEIYLDFLMAERLQSFFTEFIICQLIILNTKLEEYHPIAE
jgi:hypothetical protein